MKRTTKTQLLNLGVTLLTLAGMYLSNKVHDREMRELKDEIKLELIQEKEEQND